MTQDQGRQFRDENLDLLILLDATARDVLRTREIELNQCGLTHIQARVLNLLRNIPDGVKLSEISNMLSRKPHSVSGLISRMEQNGLVKKTKVPPGRTIIVTIEDKGLQLYTNASWTSLEMMFSIFSNQEKSELSSYMTRLRLRTRELLGLDYKPPFLT